MKKVLLALLASVTIGHLQAQNITPEADYVHGGSGKQKAPFNADSLLSNWCLDLNLTGGMLSQRFTAGDPSAYYLNAVNSNITDLKFRNGSSIGFDAEIAYFFDKARNWGVGAGLWYMSQHGTATLDNFHVEYQSNDYAGNVFRQVITANAPINEKLRISNFNIPLLLKYKKRFSKNIGFTADAGLMFNLSAANSYTTDATFDYEAIYKFTGTQGAVKTVYDNSTVPGASDLLITRKYQSTVQPDVQAYFDQLRKQGNNVGLNMAPSSNTGKSSYKGGSVGILLRPAVSFYLSDNIALNVGAYYLYQRFSNNGSGGMITDKIGTYNSVLGNVSKVTASSLGISAGVRIYLSKARKPYVPEVAAEPEEKTTEIISNPPPPEHEDVDVTPVGNMNDPILFDLNKTEIKPESYPTLEDAINHINNDSKAHIIVHGYTDNTGTATYNRGLSKRRANAVKTFLVDKGVKSSRVKTIGHGSKSPAASNRTSEGRAKNRRAVMKLKQN